MNCEKIEKLAIPDLESFLALENKREPRVAAVPGANLRSNGARRLARVAELDAGAVARGLPHPCPGRGGARRTEQIWRGALDFLELRIMSQKPYGAVEKDVDWWGPDVARINP